ncbi:unnamed protein product [Dicrocoelium dendriticum]|nr:unnamed protein product [Dicrocoelium dendriticum]
MKTSQKCEGNCSQITAHNFEEFGVGVSTKKSTYDMKITGVPTGTSRHSCTYLSRKPTKCCKDDYGSPDLRQSCSALLRVRRRITNRIRVQERRPYKEAPSLDLFKIQAFRAETRRAKSRQAAQIRRNREGQNLMLLQNALPISADVLGLNGMTSSSMDSPLNNLLPLFEDELALEKWISNECTQSEDANLFSHLRLFTSSSSSSWAVNMEKTDVIRIAGHTLFFLNRIGSYLGVTTDAPTLSLRSHSLYTVVVDPLDNNRIVYTSPSLAEVAGIDWITLLGAPIEHLVQSVIPPPRAHSTVGTIGLNSKRKSNLSTVHRSDDMWYCGHSRINRCSGKNIQANEFICLHTPTSSRQAHYSLLDEEKGATGVRDKKSSRVEITVSPELYGAAVCPAETTAKFYCWASMMLHPLTEFSVSQSRSLHANPASPLENESHGTTLAPIAWLLLHPVPLTYSTPLILNEDLSIPFFSDNSISVGPSIEQKRTKQTRKGASKNGNPRHKKTRENDKPHEFINDVTLELVSEILNPSSIAHQEVMQPESNPCSSSILSCSTSLDNLLVIQDANGNVSECFGQEEECGLIGWSFLSFIHLDDLETLVNLFSQANMEKPMFWTPLYRVSVNKSNTPLRRYRWIRSLICCTGCAGQLKCWHQQVGCESSSLTYLTNLDHEMVAAKPISPTQHPSSISTEAPILSPFASNSLFTNVLTSTTRGSGPAPLISLFHPSKKWRVVRQNELKFHKLELKSDPTLLPGQFMQLPPNTRHVGPSVVAWRPSIVKTSSSASHRQRVIGLGWKPADSKPALNPYGVLCKSDLERCSTRMPLEHGGLEEPNFIFSHSLLLGILFAMSHISKLDTMTRHSCLASCGEDLSQLPWD